MSSLSGRIVMNRRRRLRSWAFAGGVLLVIGLLILVVEPRPRPIDAQTLLARANGTTPLTLDADQVLYYRTTVFQRMNPEASEPPDPYHKPVLEHFSDTFVVEHWIRGGEIVQSRTIARDRRSGEVLYEFMRDGNRYGRYNVAQGYAIIGTYEPHQQEGIPPKTSTANSEEQGFLFPELTRLEGFEIKETIISPWGRPAWLVTARGAPPSAETLAAVEAAPPPFGRPYLADLDISHMEYAWLIDQESWRYVRFEERAITPSGPVLVERSESSPPEVLDLDTLPDSWLTFPLEEGIPTMQVRSISGSQMSFPRSVPLDEAIAAADFEVFLPDTTTLGPVHTLAYFKPEVVPEEVWRQHWRFDIQVAHEYGLTLQVIYFPNQPRNGKALVVIEGSSDRLVPLMRETLPIWTESHAVPLTIGSQKVVGWVATGGVLSNPPERVVVMLEIQGTFLFVVGQSYSEGQVLDLVRTLHPVRP